MKKLLKLNLNITTNYFNYYQVKMTRDCHLNVNIVIVSVKCVMSLNRDVRH